MNQEQIGKFIQNLRKMKKLTQQELALKLGVTDRAISKWENGRGMPDYSLIKPLCDELDITVNELLSGKKLNKEEESKSFENNVLNTLDYSSKKIRHTKFIYKIILTFIVLLITSFLVLFGIDVYKMRNNEPVLFSTWGFKYAPPVNLDWNIIESTIKKYMIEEDEKSNDYEDEKSFIAMRTYLVNEEKDKYYVYAWVLQEKFYKKDDEVIMDTGSSIPYKFEIIKENDNYFVNDYTIPRDGIYYTEDMKSIFPNSVLKDMDNVHFDGTIENLEFNIQNQVDAYFK